MHTVTFYSFKGGVGRTLALVNVGVELANTGRRVLLVDFDLEAPGIDTYSALAPPVLTKGIVDYVSSYLEFRQAPDLNDYVYKVDQSDRVSGELWVMPAGKRDREYGSKLSRIDWQDLYERRDGFLLLEDLKLKWESDIQPDYVLIDSRTGHTEVGGICTRQLPDTVVSLFIPNQQNLQGLGSVVDAIHKQNKNSNKQINLEFVASNVPDLDDEHQILRRMMGKFHSRLSGNGPRLPRTAITTINRYDSMHLLDESIFLSERPRSRLAKQYRMLLKRIISHNLDDREAALRALTRSFPRGGRFEQLSIGDFEGGLSYSEQDKIQTVLRKHANDAEVHFLTGQLLKSRGDFAEASLQFARAFELAKEGNDAEIGKYHLELVNSMSSLDSEFDAMAHLEQLLQQSSSSLDMEQLLGLLGRFSEVPSRKWLGMKAFADLSASEMDDLVWQVSDSRSWQRFFVELFNRSSDQLPEQRIADFTNLTLAAIGSGQWCEVVKHLQEPEVLSSHRVDINFNFAMARWAADRFPTKKFFSKVLDLYDENPVAEGPNFLQCLAVCELVVGDIEMARNRIATCKALEHRSVFLEFSCWSYLRLGRDRFAQDLNEIERLVNGEQILPRFIRDADGSDVPDWTS
ncbi:ParA family protein [Rhodopirellula bahusiensis]|nr:AAA family ATPase [Rhodopirellula bahusiensis]